MSQDSDHIDYRETPDLTEIHAAIQREHKDPQADVTPMPLWLTIVCGGVICWAGAYVGMFHGGFSGKVFNEFESSPAVLFSTPTRTADNVSTPVVEDLAAIGKGVYQTCQACHQANGLGQPGAIPPLAGSEWVLGNEKRLTALVLKGVMGPLKVKGQTYNGMMPAQEAALSDKKLAAVLSYIRNEWGNVASQITPAQVTAARKEFSGKKVSFSEAELLQIPENAKLEGGALETTATPAKQAESADGAATASAPTGSTSITPIPGNQANAATSNSTQTLSPAGTIDTAKLLEDGKRNYMTICVACHQPTGLGLPMLFPPLVNNEYVNGAPDRLAAMVLKGVSGPLMVDGKQYNNMMPGQESVLSDEKIAGILTYIRASFGNSSSPVTPEIVSATRKKVAGHTAPWTETELKSWGTSTSESK